MTTLSALPVSPPIAVRSLACEELMFSTKLFSIVLIGFAFLACGSAVRCEANEFEVQSQGRYEQVVAAHRAKMATYKDFRRLS